MAEEAIKQVEEAFRQEMEKKETGKKQKKEKRKQWISRILIAVLLIAIILLVMYLLGFFRPKSISAIQAGDMFPGQTDAEDGTLPMSEEDLLAQMQMAVDESYFSFKINAEPYFENGSSTGNVGIENPTYNVYPMVVQITLDETGEIIYDSGGLMPGQYISDAKLTQVLSRGEHTATATLYAYDPDTLVCQGKSQAALVITVEN